MISPPRARNLYFIASAVAAAVFIIAAIDFGVFREELHPDPTRGSYAGLFAVLLSGVAFCASAALLVLVRWLLWPKARTKFWNIQATVIAALIVLPTLFFAISSLVYFGELQSSSERGWIAVEGAPVVQGTLPPYYPSSSIRLVWFDDASQAERFREYAVDGSTVYRREGWSGSGYQSNVEKRVFPSPEKAKAEADDLIRQSQDEGYEIVQ